MRFDVLLIDGRSGSGKTSHANRVIASLRASGVSAQVLRVEDLYPGWDGLAEGSRAVARALDEGRYRRYDWIRGAFAETVRIDPRPPLIIEGCGAITEANVVAARAWAGRVDPALRSDPEPIVRALWLDAPEALRRERALARDGETFAPHWERWAAHEDAHFAVHRPWLLADEVDHAHDAALTRDVPLRDSCRGHE